MSYRRRHRTILRRAAKIIAITIFAVLAVDWWSRRSPLLEPVVTPVLVPNAPAVPTPPALELPRAIAELELRPRPVVPSDPDPEPAPVTPRVTEPPRSVVRPDQRSVPVAPRLPAIAPRPPAIAPPPAVSAPPAAAPPAVSAPAVPVPPPVSAPPAEARTAIVPPPIPALPEPPRVAPAPAPGPPSATAADAGAVRSARDMAAVQAVLDRYRQMYSQLDAASATAIWPQADTRALERVFARLQRQELDFDDCVIALAERSATAQCAGQLRYIPRVGNTEWRSERHSWTIQLQRGADDWTIVRVSAR